MICKRNHRKTNSDHCDQASGQTANKVKDRHIGEKLTLTTLTKHLCWHAYLQGKVTLVTQPFTILVQRVPEHLNWFENQSNATWSIDWGKIIVEHHLGNITPSSQSSQVTPATFVWSSVGSLHRSHIHQKYLYKYICVQNGPNTKSTILLSNVAAFCEFPRQSCSTEPEKVWIQDVLIFYDDFHDNTRKMMTMYHWPKC